MTFDRTVVGDVTVLAPEEPGGQGRNQSFWPAIDEVAAKGTPIGRRRPGQDFLCEQRRPRSLVRAAHDVRESPGLFRLARVGDRINAIFLVTKLVLISIRSKRSTKR